MACLKRLILTTFLSHLAIPVPLPPAVQALLGRSRTPFDSPGLDTQAGHIALWLGAHGTGADTSRPESEADRLAAPPRKTLAGCMRGGVGKITGPLRRSRTRRGKEGRSGKSGTRTPPVRGDATWGFPRLRAGAAAPILMAGGV